MKYLAAYLLLVAGGNATPAAADIKNLLGSVGVEVEDERVAALTKALEGKSVEEVNTHTHFFNNIQYSLTSRVLGSC